MGKKSKRKNKEKSATEIVDEEISVRENVLSYTDYNTIMSIQLLIDRLNEVIGLQRETRSQLSAVREEVQESRAILEMYVVPEEERDGNKGQPNKGQPNEDNQEGPFGRRVGEDNPPGTDE